VSEGEEHHVKNNAKIDDCRKSQLKFECEVYLLNYTIKFFKNLNSAFEVFRFKINLKTQKVFKNLKPQKPNLGAKT